MGCKRTSWTGTMPSSSSTASQRSQMKKYWSLVCRSVTWRRLKNQDGFGPELSCQMRSADSGPSGCGTDMTNMSTPPRRIVRRRESRRRRAHVSPFSPINTKCTFAVVPERQRADVQFTSRLQTDVVVSSNHTMLCSNLLVEWLQIPALFLVPVYTTSSYRYLSLGSLQGSGAAPA